MSLSDLSIRKPVFAWMLMAAMMIFGFLSFQKMGVSQLPDVDFPIVNISVVYEGAAPEVMELDVIDPIESAVMGVEGVKTVSSSARLGSANISVEFNLDKNLDNAVSEVEAKINQASRNLPDTMERPVVTKVNPDDRPIMWLAVSSDTHSPKEIMSYVRDQLKDKIQTSKGVADVFLGGYVEPNLRVWVDQDKLNQRDLTVTDIMTAIRQEHKESPSGFVEDLNTEMNVRTLGEADSVEEFKKIPIIRRGGAANFAPLFLGEVAQIEDGLADVRRISRVMGKSAVGLGVRKQRGSNTVEVAKSVKEKMEEIKKILPAGMEIGINFDSTTFIEDSIHELNFTMILSSILTAIVCWLFLGSLSATFNVVLAIPTSILGSFILIKYLGFTLNTFTLLGLSLAIGIVVDDAIMVLENIFRHHEEGKDKVKASLDGANEIAFAALAATVAIMAIFIPVTMMDGIIGKYFYQFGMTLSIAVGLSYVEALTLTPMRTSQFMGSSARSSKIGIWVDDLFIKLVSSYERSLNWCLKYKKSVLLCSLIFFLGTFYLIKFIPKEFVPAQDTSSFLMRVKTKDGASLEFTSEKVKEVENFLIKQKEVKRFFVAIGGFGGNESNSANLFVTLENPKDRPLDAKKNRPLKQLEIIDVYREHFKNFKGGKVFIQDTSQGGFSASGRGFPVEFTLTGPNWKELILFSKQVVKDMDESGFFVDIDTDYKESVSEIQILPNREKAKNYAVSVDEIGITINALIGGVVVGKFSKDGHRNDIRVKMNSIEDYQKSLEKIFVRNTRGELIRLLDVTTVEKRPGVQSITRKQRSRAISIFAGLPQKMAQADALNKVKTIVEKNQKPGYQLLESGSSEAMKDSFKSLIFALVLGIIVAYMILGAQFNSFLDPVTILMALPFSFSGAFIGLLIMGQSLNIYSIIGLILLMGIVKKNSILLVDFTNQRQLEGLKTEEALKDACPKRLRPILMTTFSTVAGAVPLAFSFGPGSETLAPMAVAVIGGSLVSTVLTLYVVPALYSLLSKLKRT